MLNCLWFALTFDAVLRRLHVQRLKWQLVRPLSGNAPVPLSGKPLRDHKMEMRKGGLRQALFRKPSARVTWLCAFFLLGYVGIEVALGGWIVTFMTRVRHGPAFASGMTATGFWLGITVGRVALGFVTPRVGEKISISV